MKAPSHLGVLRVIWAWLWADADPISRQIRQGRTAAIKQLLQTHATENRLRVLHPASDGREVVSEWQRHRQRLQARARKRSR